MTEARILLADEDTQARMNLRETLERLGYLVIGDTAYGLELLHMVRQFRPDLIFADLKLSDIDGIECVRMVYQEKLAPVILTTRQSNRDLVDLACKAGVLAYMIKPIQEGELMPVIEVVRARWNEHQERYQEITQLQDQIETRAVIESAKAFLMDNHGLREAEAFRKIQRLAMNNRRTMREVAQAILLTRHIRV